MPQQQGRNSESMTARTIGNHTSTRENKGWELWDNGLQAAPSRRYSVSCTVEGVEISNIPFRDEMQARKEFERKIETYYNEQNGKPILIKRRTA